MAHGIANTHHMAFVVEQVSDQHQLLAVPSIKRRRWPFGMAVRRLL